MSTKDIRTTDTHAACNVCGRTLLRGEQAVVFVSGGSRRSVCELCTDRAVHAGWVREGAAPSWDGAASSGERRRSLFGRLRSRRDGGASARAESEYEDGVEPPPVAPVRAPAPRLEPALPREPRHVRAVPTSGEQRIASGVEVFNSSEHRRTIAGVARSLGAPTVSVLASDQRTSVVTIVVSWELCWYRYEVELSDEVPNVRVGDQGYELDELPEPQRVPNAVADEHGGLTLQ
ncbi:MAG TPA: hypothetical protein VMD48_07475 [Solirubrobacteraceae bacterium]|nr:hypothetical protein [Solirubrobacteraceae bacterium]